MQNTAWSCRNTGTRRQPPLRRRAGEILTYDGAPIEAVYFSCSGGSTEAAVAVWGTDVPYLQAVESPGEQDALRYESEAAFLEDELRAILNKAAPEAKLDGPSEGWFGEPFLTEGGGVASVTIGGEDFTGTQLRSLLGLNSTRFTVTCGDGEVVFHVRGFGHRVGMSQYGANAMASWASTIARSCNITIAARA